MSRRNRHGSDSPDRIADETLANVGAMEAAVELGSSTDTITLDNLLGIHRTSMEQSMTPGIAGAVHTRRNSIGGSTDNPCSAALVPPPPETIDALLDDLVVRVSADSRAPLTVSRRDARSRWARR